MNRRGWRLLHAAVLGLLAIGIAAWLWRTYGFAPLALSEARP